MAYSMQRHLSAFMQLPIDLIILLVQVVLYILPSCRPDRRWTYDQAVRVKAMRIGVKYAALFHKRTVLSLEGGKETNRFVIVDPAPIDKYDGPTADDVVHPRPIGLTWTPAAPQLSSLKDSSVIALHFHGGAYATGTGRDSDTGFAAKMLRRHLGCSLVCSPSYRLATNKHGYFPAALQDAITAYLHLVDEMQIDPSQIILSGDSAGGNLVLALLRYLDEYGAEQQIPLPGAVALWSPWVDIRDSLESPLEPKPNYSTDYLTTPFARWAGSALTRNGAIDPAQPYLSPLLHPFALRNGKVPVFLQTGDRELLYGDNVLLADRLKLFGWPVKLFVSAACPHDIMMFGSILGFEAEAANAADEAKDYFISATKLQLQG
ncbi:hypothetical protein NLU13_8764 [Sarocladium strictum]|uniref:Alpha/beta hydrolase fold-3 domain-containing protein n=1 Tax=Sarocladium strictum TaxID=5046 RepID=A0AA39L5A0_SARSR|nr:hypothetical protein NLU13_8764 [Sarocladium strictum]